MQRSQRGYVAGKFAEAANVEIADADSLQPLERADRNTVMALAVFFGKTRLIDNLRLP